MNSIARKPGPPSVKPLVPQVKSLSSKPAAPKPLMPKAADINKQVKSIAPAKPPPLKGKTHTAIDNHLLVVEKMKEGQHEVQIIDHTTDGRRELDRVCIAKGKHWGIVRTSTTSPGPDGRAVGHKPKLKVHVLIGEMYEFEVEEENGYPQAVDAALLGLAAELENE